MVTCCREVLGRSFVGKCVWGEVLYRCSEGVLPRSVVVKCCRQVLGRSVEERCCEEML